MVIQNYLHLINQDLTNTLLFNTLLRDNYVMRACKHFYTGWAGGTMPVPREAGEAINMQSGGNLVPLADLQIDQLFEGTITGHKQLHMGMIVYARDTILHSKKAKIPEDTFYRIKIMELLMRQKARFQFNFSHQILTGNALAKLTAAGTSNTGVLTVDKPQNLSVGQKLILKGAGGSPPANETLWIRYIDMNAKTVTVATSKSLATTDTADKSSFITGSTIHSPGDETDTNTFKSIPSQILPASHPEGDATIFGVTKANYPILQATYLDDSMNTNTRQGLLDRVFDTVQNFITLGQPYKMTPTGKLNNETGKIKRMGRGSGNPIDVVMSLGMMNVFRKLFFADRSKYFRATSGDVNFFDGKNFRVCGPDNRDLIFRGIPGMRDDMIYFFGEDVFFFPTWNFIDPYVSPDGNKWYESRHDTNGYSYVTDLYLWGEFVVKRPAGCAVLFGLNDPNDSSNYAS